MDECDYCNRPWCYGCPYAEEETKPKIKLQAELSLLVSKLQCIEELIKIDAKKFRKQGDFETKFALHCLRAVTSDETICEWYDKYNCNDDHITTLAKRALKEVYSIEEDTTK